MKPEEIKDVVRRYVLEQFLPGEDAAALTDDVRLISDGIVDSLGSLKLVAYIEERFGVRIDAHEVDAEHLDLIDDIVAMVKRRMKS